MEALIVFLGISSFVITGVDDFLVLILFHMKYKNKFKAVILGTLIGLIAVMIPSFIFAKLLVSFDISKYVSTEIILAIMLCYIAFGLIKDGFSESEEETVDNLNEKSYFQVVIVSAITYFMNGLDDFVVYSGFYLKYEKISEILFFSLGIILGLVLFALLSAYAGKKFLEFEKRFQNKIKVVVGSIVLFSAVFVLFR